MVTTIPAEMRSALHIASTFLHFNQNFMSPRFATCPSSPTQLRLPLSSPSPSRWMLMMSKVRAFSNGGDTYVEKVTTKPSICTADELHYVSVPNSDWRLALWRYHPHPEAPARNHPLLLLSGVGTNAIGYDLSPESSFARYMSGQGFDTWILEVRGAGLSVRSTDSKGIEPAAQEKSDQMEAAIETATEEVRGAGLSVRSTDSKGIEPAAQEKSDQMEAAIETATEEVRGAGLNMQSTDSKCIEPSAHAISGQMEAATETGTEGIAPPLQPSADDQFAIAQPEQISGNGDPSAVAKMWDESKLVTMLTETFMHLSERLSGFLSEGQSKIISAKFFDQISRPLTDSKLIERFNETKEKLLALLEAGEKSTISGQLTDLSQMLVNIIEEGQRTVSPPLFDLQERLSATIEDFHKQLDLIVTYDWDFDHYLEDDIPIVIEYVKAQTKPKDDKLFAIGHSMGGILLYALMSRSAYEGRDPGLSAVVTLASSLDYSTSKSSLRLLLPLADPAQALNVPAVPLGMLLSAAYPLSSRPPYVLSWLNHMISAEDMMHPELLKKLVLNNFCTIPAKLLLQLTSAFREGGLRDRSGTFFYKDHLQKSNVPVLAVAGDQDWICPPEAVHETVKLIPDHLATYKVFGEEGGPHYAHYDLVGGRLAVEQIYPCIVQFLSTYD